MKKLLSILLFTGFFINQIAAQDIIVKKNSDEINAKIIEITDNQIKYKEFDFIEGPTRNINTSEVFMIIYENGKREKFTNTAPVTHPRPAQSQSTDSNEASSSSKEENKSSNKEKNYFSIGLGYGVSYGGSGIRLQYKIRGKIGIHIGGGYFIEKDEVLYSGGVQYYFWDNMYVDAQYGAFGVQEVFYSNYNGYDYNYYYERELLMGPSLLIGYDWYFTEHFGVMAALGASYDHSYDTGFWPSIDGGFVIRF